MVPSFFTRFWPKLRLSKFYHTRTTYALYIETVELMFTCSIHIFIVVKNYITRSIDKIFRQCLPKVPVPDLAGRREIFQYYLGKVKIGNDVEVEVMARGTTGFTGQCYCTVKISAQLYIRLWQRIQKNISLMTLVIVHSAEIIVYSLDIRPLKHIIKHKERYHHNGLVDYTLTNPTGNFK